MPELQLLGFTGHATSGKSHCASLLQNYLQQVHNIDAPIVAFADSLKELTHTIYPLLPKEKENPTTRKAYQELGSTLRNTISPHIFVDALHHKITKKPYPYTYIIQDARFPEEFDYILPPNTNTNNHLFHITRPGVGPLNEHESETKLLQIQNSDHPNITHIHNDPGNPISFYEVFSDSLPHLFTRSVNSYDC